MNRFRNLMTTMTLLLTTAAFAQPSLTAPSVVFTTGTTGNLVDITISNAPVGDNITGADLFLRYDSDVATATDVLTSGTAADGWNLAYNIVEDVAAGNIDEIRISMASSLPLAVPGSGALIQIAFSAASTTSPTSASLDFTLAELNEAAVTATAGLITIGGATSTIGISASVAVGADITVTVDDVDLTGTGPLTATITNTDNGDTETVSLTEGAAGSFSGTIATAFSIAASSNPALDVQAGDTVTVSFDDPFDANGVAQTVATTAGDLTIIGGTTSTIGISGTVAVGDDITVTVDDADLAGAGPLTATITNTDNGDTETVSLTEGAAGSFSGTITTAFSVAASNNPKLDVQAGDTVTASFDDPYSSSGGPQTVSTSAGDLTITGGTTATLALSPAAVDAGDDITVTVVDADLAGQGPLTATISNDDNGDTHSVTLTEGASGTFAGTITTVFGSAASSGNNLLDVKAGDEISASFDDPYDATGGPQTIATTPGDLTIGGGTTATMSLGPTTLNPGDQITVTVIDPDEVGNGPLTALIINTTTGDTETVSLTEAASPPAAAGTFTAAITTVFASAASSENGLLGIAPGDVVSAEYVDSFNDVGGSETISPPAGNDLTILGGTTGTLTASAGVQAGGTLRIEVQDADLNVDPGALDTIQVTVTNQSVANEVETVTLWETGVNTAIFQLPGGAPTSSAAGSAEDGTLQVSPQDLIETDYVDELRDDGSLATLTAATSGTLWGDTSGNGTLRALDASLILQENVGSVTFDAYQTLVGDVSAPGVGAIPLNGFDAVLILRYVVGLEASFPDVESGTPVHPYKRAAIGRRLALGSPEAIDGLVQLPLVVSEAEDLLAGNLTIGFDPAQIRIAGVTGSDLTGNYEVASHVEDGQLRIAFAGTESRGVGQGSILHIAIEPLADVELVSALTIESANLNGGLSPVEVVDSPAALAVPQVFGLSQNWPNPFNPETQIQYTLPQDAHVTLTVYDAVGQTVSTLVQEHQASGQYTVRWDALNQAGQSVASGIYFYRLHTGSITMTRKMSLLR